jgi:hypothetical protein
MPAFFNAAIIKLSKTELSNQDSEVRTKKANPFLKAGDGIEEVTGSKLQISGYWR